MVGKRDASQGYLTKSNYWLTLTSRSTMRMQSRATEVRTQRGKRTVAARSYRLNTEK